MTPEEYSKLCKTQKGKDNIAHELANGINTRFWKILECFMESHGKVLQDKINDINTEDEKAVQRAKIELHYLKVVKGMPKTIAEQLLNNNKNDSAIKKDTVYE